MHGFPLPRRLGGVFVRVVSLRPILGLVLVGVVAGALAGCEVEKSAVAPAPAEQSADAVPASTSGAVPASHVVAATTSADAVERGRYLVSVWACTDCHTPWKMGPNGPEPDMERFLSGHPEGTELPPPPQPSGPWIWFGSGTNTAFAGPWGVSFAANLTPDVNTGLGIWDEEMFIKTIRTGKHMGQSRPIMPPMPWPAYRNGTDEDLKAVYAYLRSLPPVHNRVPDYQPPAGPPVGQPAG